MDDEDAQFADEALGRERVVAAFEALRTCNECGADGDLNENLPIQARSDEAFLDMLRSLNFDRDGDRAVRECLKILRLDTSLRNPAPISRSIR